MFASSHQINLPACKVEQLICEFVFCICLRVRSHEQRFPRNSLPKLHTLQSTLTIFHGIITVSQYQQTVKTF